MNAVDTAIEALWPLASPDLKERLAGEVFPQEDAADEDERIAEILVDALFPELCRSSDTRPARKASSTPVQSGSNEGQ